MNLIVYHIFCYGNYVRVAQDQINRLVASGLYEWCDRLEVTCIDTTNKFSGIKEIFEPLKKVNIFFTDKNYYEYWALKKIWDYSHQKEGKVFYFHTKGITNRYENISSGKISPIKSKAVDFWKELLEYYLIDNWKDCLEKLTDYDNCGVTCNEGWYWGNFWWSNLSYVKANPEPQPGSSRWAYEAWLNYARNFKFHEFYHFEFNPYYTILPNDIYTNIDFYKDASLEVVSAFYGVLGEQQDEGRPILERTVIDVTSVIKQNLASNNYRGFNIAVNNDLGGDPYFGVTKMLEIRFLINNTEYVLVVDENRQLSFYI